MQNVLLNTLGDELSDQEYREAASEGVPDFLIEHKNCRFLIVRGYERHDQNNALQAVARWASRTGLSILADYTSLADRVAFVEPRPSIDELVPAAGLPDTSAGEAESASRSIAVGELRVRLPRVVGDHVSAELPDTDMLPAIVSLCLAHYAQLHPGRTVTFSTELGFCGVPLRPHQIGVIRVPFELGETAPVSACVDAFRRDSSGLVERLNEEGFAFTLGVLLGREL